MTDPHPNTTADAQEWAKAINAGDTYLPQEWTDAAADLITDLAENWVSIKAMQEWRRKHHGSISDNALKDFADLLPSAPTMADIKWCDDEHRFAGAEAENGHELVMLERRWVEGHPGLYVILCVDPEGKVDTWIPGLITPTGRKYRLEPEDDTRTGTESENVSHGQPEPQTGEAWLIDIDGERTVALLGKVDPADDEPTWFTDDGGGYSCDSGNPVARLVPEATEQDDEPTPSPDYVYTDREGDEWEHLDGRWITGDTHAERVAARKIRFGADSLPEEYAPYKRDRLVPETTEQDAEQEFDPDYTYTARNGRKWEHIDGRWITAETHAEQGFDPAYTYRDRDGEHWSYLNHNWRCVDYGRDATNYLTPPTEYGPYTRIETEIDPAYIYTDGDGDEWEYIEGRWVIGGTHADRVIGRKVRPGLDSLPEEYGPYTRIEDTK